MSLWKHKPYGFIVNAYIYLSRMVWIRNFQLECIGKALKQNGIWLQGMQSVKVSLRTNHKQNDETPKATQKKIFKM